MTPVPPAEIDPVVVPPTVPVPAPRASEMFVARVVGALVLPYASFVPTTTSKPVPAVGFAPPLTAVIVSAEAEATPTAALRSGELETVPSVTWIVGLSTL